MVGVVVDNSIVVSWLHKGQANEYSERLLDAHIDIFHTSFIWPAEFANVATVMVKRGILSCELGKSML